MSLVKKFEESCRQSVDGDVCLTSSKQRTYQTLNNLIKGHNMQINGFFISVWEDGTSIETPATLDLETGEVCSVSSEDTSDHGSLEEEKFISSSGEEYEVCMECHEYIVKTEMNCYDGTNQIEEKSCKGRCHFYYLF